MKLPAIGLGLGLVLLAAGCRQVDIRHAALYIPAMTNQACVAVVLKALSTEQAVAPNQITVQLEARTLDVRYDSLRHSLKNLEFTVADAGFAVNDIPANEAAQRALPPACR